MFERAAASAFADPDERRGRYRLDALFAERVAKPLGLEGEVVAKLPAAAAEARARMASVVERCVF